MSDAQPNATRVDPVDRLFSMNSAFYGFGFGIWLNRIEIDGKTLRLITIAVGPVTLFFKRK